MSVELLEKFKPLAPWFAKHRRDCWLPVVEDGEGGPTDSRFAGSPWLKDSEEWPACGLCKGPMALFLQLNLATVPDPVRAHLGGDGLLQAFFCLDLDCMYGKEEGDPFTRTHLLRVIDPQAEAGSPRCPPADSEPSEIPARRIIRWDRADDYPSMAEAEELGLWHEVNDQVVCKDPPFSVKAKLKEFFKMPWARDNEKLGGWPGWANICTVYPQCRKCKRRMDLVIFQFGHEGYIPIMFGDGGQGHIVCCPDHPRELAYPWSCG